MTSLAALTDADLVARCRSGDRDAWNELVGRFSRYVHAIAVQAYRLPIDDAEDVFQEVFSRVYEHLDGLRSDEAVRPWIGQLARRLCVDRLRAGGRVQVLPEPPEPAELDARLERIEEALVVHDALTRLSPECREILDRFFCRDESYRTIGEALELPFGTIASRISRCLARLRLELEDAQPEGREPGAGTS
jgi:RNA polymerase sigma-70 factor (ECF subfamily)